MTTVRLHIARFLAVWLLLIPFKTTVWHHLCLISGRADTSLFPPSVDPCHQPATATSTDVLPNNTCCAKFIKAKSKDNNDLLVQTNNINPSLLASDDAAFSPEANCLLVQISDGNINCCETNLENLGLDSDKIGKITQNDIAGFDIQAIILPLTYRTNHNNLFVDYPPVCSQVKLPFTHAPPPLPYGKQKLKLIQIYRC